MKIEIFKKETINDNLRIIQGIRYLNTTLTLKEAHDIYTNGGEFTITSTDNGLVKEILKRFEELDCEYKILREKK